MTHPLNAALAYLATPYTKFPGGIGAAFAGASRLAARLLQAGVNVYSPIAHTHPLAMYGNLDPLDLTIWLPSHQAMLAKADVLIVARMKGWEASKGIAHEIRYFERAKKPIYDLDPLTLSMKRREAVAA